MDVYSVLTVLCFTLLTSATPLSQHIFPLQDQQHAITDLKNRIFSPATDNTQLPLTPPQTPSPDTLTADTATLEITGWNIYGIPAYTTPIAVGSPNQVFRALLDLDFGGLLVRAANCGEETDDDCGYGGDLGLVYNASASETYEDGHERFHFMLPAHHVYGQVARDGVQLVRVGLENVTLGAVDGFHGENYFYMVMADLADGALGLAPPNATTSLPYTVHPAPNILSHLLSQAPLAAPIITFSLPTYINTYEPNGTITLGALPPGHSSINTRILFGDLSHGWNVPLDGLTLESSSSDGKAIHLDLSDNMAFYPSFVSGLQAPHNLTEALYKHLHALPDSGWIDVREFNCSFRGQLQDITFVSGGKEITFEEEDYTLHGWFGDEEVCFLTIVEHEQPGLDELVAVGTMLWEKWHVVFEFDEDVDGKQGMGLIPRSGDGKRSDGGVDVGSLRRRQDGAH